jgi:hypothetical protein
MAGMTSEIIDTLRDDYPKKSYPLFTLAIDDNIDTDLENKNDKKRLERKLINRVLSIFALRNQSHFYIPIETKTLLSLLQHTHHFQKVSFSFLFHKLQFCLNFA